MPVSVQWYLEPYILQSVYSDHTSIQDILNAVEISNRLTQDAPHGIYLLVDFALAESFPTNFRELRTVTSQNVNPKIRLRLVYGRNELVNLIANTFARAFGVSVHFFDELADALDWLKLHDPALVPLLNNRRMI